jgi:hypothetical protein
MEQLRAIGALARALAALVFALPETAGATTYAPVNRAGPRLSVPAAKLAAALKCDGPLAGAAHPPVLLVPGATLNPTTDFSYGWEPALRQLGYPYCTIDLPGNAMADVQTAGEYVVYAIRTMHAAYGGRIDIIGHSQGGMVPRWALRFWPDTRAMVDDLIGLSPSNHGDPGRDPALRRRLCGLDLAAALQREVHRRPELAAGDVRRRLLHRGVHPDRRGGGAELRPRRRRCAPGKPITNVAIQTVCAPPTRRSTSASGSTTPPPMRWPWTRSPIPGPPTPPASPGPSAWIR